MADVDIADDVWSMPLGQINPAQPALMAADKLWPMFERLRKEDPVHYTADSDYGPFWSITRYADIRTISLDHETYSSAKGTAIADGTAGGGLKPSLIHMDPPEHDEQRRAINPGLSVANLKTLTPLIRERAAKILDALPIGEEFDWVDKVAVELTAMTLATLFDVPQEDRRKLVYWSDVILTTPGAGLVDTPEQKAAILEDLRAYFVDLWNRRVNAPPAGDLISMLAHNPATRDMSPDEYFGTVILLTTGGNETTRNSISGSLLGMNRFPDQHRKLRADPRLLPAMVSEAIRWQTPIGLVRRTATRDTEIGGKVIRNGDKVIAWYMSANRDGAVFEDAHSLDIERAQPRAHISFGYGIHHCVGNRLAELQLSIVWEEILKRFPEIIVTGEPSRSYSLQIRGYDRMPVTIPRR